VRGELATSGAEKFCAESRSLAVWSAATYKEGREPTMTLPEPGGNGYKSLRKAGTAWFLV